MHVSLTRVVQLSGIIGQPQADTNLEKMLGVSNFPRSVAPTSNTYASLYVYVSQLLEPYWMLNYGKRAYNLQLISEWKKPYHQHVEIG